MNSTEFCLPDEVWMKVARNLTLVDLVRVRWVGSDLKRVVQTVVEQRAKLVKKHALAVGTAFRLDDRTTVSGNCELRGFSVLCRTLPDDNPPVSEEQSHKAGWIFATCGRAPPREVGPPPEGAKGVRFAFLRGPIARKDSFEHYFGHAHRATHKHYVVLEEEDLIRLATHLRAVEVRWLFNRVNEFTGNDESIPCAASEPKRSCLIQ